MFYTTKIFHAEEIKEVVEPYETIQAIEKGFRLLSEGQVVLAPLSQLEMGPSIWYSKSEIWVHQG